MSSIILQEYLFGLLHIVLNIYWYESNPGPSNLNPLPVKNFFCCEIKEIFDSLKISFLGYFLKTRNIVYCIKLLCKHQWKYIVFRIKVYFGLGLHLEKRYPKIFLLKSLIFLDLLNLSVATVFFNYPSISRFLILENEF